MTQAPRSERTAQFEDLFRRTRADLLRYLARRAGNPEEAADLLADAYLIAWRRLEDVPAGEHARLWLFGVARNLLKKRASRSWTTAVLAERLASELRAAQRIAEGMPDERANVLLAALARLGEQDREILTLTAWEGLTPSEIAAVLGMSPNRVRVRLHRVRVKLRRLVRPSRPDAHHRPAVVIDPAAQRGRFGA